MRIRRAWFFAGGSAEVLPPLMFPANVNVPNSEVGSIEIYWNVERRVQQHNLQPCECGMMAQIAQDAKTKFEQRLRGLAKNLDAISKGRGRPRELIDDFVNVAVSLLAFDEAFKMRPDEELIRRALAKLH